MERIRRYKVCGSEEPLVSDLFKELGEEAGCKALARALYTGIAGDPFLRPLFPGKSLRCATEEFSAFLVQFFDGDEVQTQYRWWLSLRESHARFEISQVQRAAWMGHMIQALSNHVSRPESQAHLGAFFFKASMYVIGRETDLGLTGELAERWARQLAVDALVQALLDGDDDRAISLAREQASRNGVFVGILARMLDVNRQPLADFALESLRQDPTLSVHRFSGRTLLHFAAGSGSVPLVRQLLSMGVDPDGLDSGGHTALYRVASCRKPESGPEIVDDLVRAGAKVNHAAGMMKSTPLHEAARHGNVAVAKALLNQGADPHLKDRKGLTPLDRAINCRRREVAAVLSGR